MTEASVSAGFARRLIEFAVAKGVGRAELMLRAGIDAAKLEDRDNRIPFANYVALMRAAKVMTGDMALALHFAEDVNIAEVSVVGLIGQASETILEAFMQASRYVRLVVDVDVGAADRFQLRHERGGLWIVDTRSNPNDFPELTESAFAQIACSSRPFGDTPLLKAVHVTHTAPTHRAEYDRVFRVPVTFESHWNALQVDESWMAHKVARLPRYVFGVLCEHAETQLERLESARTWRGRVQNLILPALHTGDTRIEAIAAKLGTSQQTLARRLKAEGTTFENVLDELRQAMALNYLRGGKVSVNETAYLLGYADATAFSRAFKRWTGKSPRAFKSEPSSA